MHIFEYADGKKLSFMKLALPLVHRCTLLGWPFLGRPGVLSVKRNLASSIHCEKHIFCCNNIQLKTSTGAFTYKYQCEKSPQVFN